MRLKLQNLVTIRVVFNDLDKCSLDRKAKSLVKKERNFLKHFYKESFFIKLDNDYVTIPEFNSSLEADFVDTTCTILHEIEDCNIDDEAKTLVDQGKFEIERIKKMSKYPGDIRNYPDRCIKVMRLRFEKLEKSTPKPEHNGDNNDRFIAKIRFEREKYWGG